MLPKTDAMAANELFIDRTFAAPAALVFRLWSDAELLKRWFGPKDFTCPSYTLDFRVGGAYRGVIRSADYPDGWFGGTFKEIVPDRKIVMSFAWEQGSGQTDLTDITITLEEADGVTSQRFHQAPFASIAERDGHLSGWNECLDKQVSYLRDNPA